MKITFNSKTQRQKGVALMITVIIVLVGAATLASYLLLTENEASSVSRSQVWNNSMTLTEAGVEEALAFINKYEGSFSMITNWATTASAQQDSWTISNSVYYVMTRTIDSNQGYYTVVIDNSNPYSPVITSQGYAYTFYSAAPSPFMLAQVGTSITTNSAPSSSRSVKVKTMYSPLFPDAIDSINQIQLNGNNVTVDSFNSTNYTYSDNTGYGYGTYDQSKAESHGNVSTDSAITDALNLGNAQILGKVNTGPGGTIGIKNNGYVGPYLAGQTYGSGITAGWSNDTMNVTFPDVVLPAGASGWASVPVSGVITNSGYYYKASISSSLTINAPYVTIYCNGGISLSGNNGITITTNVVNCSMYVAGPLVDLGGNGIVNMNGSADGHASAFSLYGLPSCIAISVHGNGDFVGTIYAPEAAFTYKGSGSAGTYVGACVVNSVTFTGNANFHYDESLASTGPARGFTPTSWSEVGAN